MISFAEYFCFRKKFLVYNFTARNLKIKYKGSFFGYLWSLLVPLAQGAIYYLVFKLIMRVQVPNYVPYILSGVLFWIFFSNTLSYGLEGLIGNRSLLTKIPIPLQVFPLVETLSNVITLLLATPVLLGVILFTHAPLGWPFFYFFYFVIVVAFIAFGLSTTLGLATVFFADIKHIFALVVQLWMYATPIFYQENMIPERWQWLLYLNPVGLAFTGMHKAVVYGEVPEARHIFVPLAWAVFAIFSGWLSMNFAKKKGVVELL